LTWVGSSLSPEKTIDGSGLDSLDQHSTSASTMWLSKKGVSPIWIQTSLDGSIWMNLANTLEFSQATGEPEYVANTIVDFASIQARFVKITINTNWADGTKQAGLSEVRFFYGRTKPSDPRLPPAAANVAINSVLNWRPGREAVKHEVRCRMSGARA
jgi:hypothetical protein